MAEQRSAREEVVRTARQVGWLGLAMVAGGVLVTVTAGSGEFGGVLALVGFVGFVGTRYLIGRYEG